MPTVVREVSSADVEREIAEARAAAALPPVEVPVLTEVVVVAPDPVPAAEPEASNE